jgi:hypothetical protein
MEMDKNATTTEYQIFVLLNGEWPELQAKLAGPDADRVGGCLQAYINAFYEKINTEDQLETLNAEWGEACVPNTDTVRTYAYWDRYGWLNDEMRRTRIHEAVLFDELRTLVAEM